MGVARKLGGVVKKSPAVPEYPVEKLATDCAAPSAARALPPGHEAFYWHVVAEESASIHVERSGFPLRSYGGVLLTMTGWRQAQSARKCSARRANRPRTRGSDSAFFF